MLLRMLIVAVVFFSMGLLSHYYWLQNKVIAKRPKPNKTLIVNPNLSNNATAILELQQQLQDLQYENEQLKQQLSLAELSVIPQPKVSQALAPKFNASQAYVAEFINTETQGEKKKLIVDEIQQWTGQIEQALLNQLHSETRPEKLVQLSVQLKGLEAQDLLDANLTRKLLQQASYVDETQQLALLTALEDAITPEMTEDLEPLLFSNHEKVYQEAFLRLQEMGVTALNRSYFEYLATNAESDWLREQAYQALSGSGF